MSLPSPPTEDPDLALMAAVAAQDRHAQRELVERLMGRVRRITRLLCRSRDEADDAAQLALLEIISSARRFRLPMNLERWSDRITVRTTLKIGRREKHRQNLLHRWLSPATLPWGRPAETAPNEAVGLDSLLGRLSEDRREAFVLHHAVGYTVLEVAKITGAPPGTVKDRLVAARKQLRRMLEREALKMQRGGRA